MKILGILFEPKCAEFGRHYKKWKEELPLKGYRLAIARECNLCGRVYYEDCMMGLPRGCSCGDTTFNGIGIWV